ncbi:MAG: hypothetical protein QOI42_1887 [Frankiaceae bacterium]|nr:hypothetical protein [Frankiaceae bacterium]
MRSGDDLGRRAFAEFLGTLLLIVAVVGSGIAAQRLSPTDTGLQLLENSVVTGCALVALILALGPVSGAFNPVVTVAERVLGALTTREAATVIVAQFGGASCGAVVANLMFGLRAVTVSTHHRSSAALWLGEVVATFGLVVIVFGVVRSGRAAAVAFAVGGYILGAYWFTSSTSFANPAAAVARILSNTFAGIAPSSVPAFVLAELVGGAIGLGAVVVLYPQASRLAADLTRLDSPRDAVAPTPETAR